MVVATKVALYLLVLCLVQGSGVVSTILFPELPIVSPESSHEQCRKDSTAHEKEIKKLTTWAYQMKDSSAKSPTGQIQGQQFALGDFDECLSVQEPLKTQYCLATVSIQLPKPNYTDDVKSYQLRPVTDHLYYSGDMAKWRIDTLRWALCIPKSCSTTDISIAVNKTLEAASLPNVTYKFHLNPEDCQDDRLDEIDTNGQIAFKIVTLVLIFIVITATCIDFKIDEFMDKKTEKVRDKLVSIFSIRQNVKALLQKERSLDTAVIHSIRFFLMFRIILGHRIMTTIMGPTSYAVATDKGHRTLESMPRVTGDVLVDNFLILSGLLATKAFLSTPEKNKLGFFRAFALRYIRLTPVLAYLTFFVATVFYKTGDGPLWREYAGFERENCQTNWWVNLLHLSNYVNTKQMCILSSYYIPLETHYFILSYPLIILLKRNSKLGLQVLGIVLLISILIPFTIVATTGATTTTYPFNDMLLRLRVNPGFVMFIKSHNRFGAYLVGIFGGYIYHRLNTTERFIPLIKAAGILTGGYILRDAIQYAAYPFFQVEPAPLIYRALYFAVLRSVWALGSIICLIALSYGAFPLFPKYVSWSGWAPLSRLTYGLYLVNMPYQVWDVAGYRHPRSLNGLKLLFNGIGDLIILLFIALLLYLFIESPFTRLSKAVLTPKSVVYTKFNEQHDKSIKESL